MDNRANQSLRLAARLARYVPLICRVLGVLSLWLALLDFNGANTSGSLLDDSWAEGLGYLLKNHFQAGADYLFTYGPLGYFTTWAYDPDLYWYKFAWELGVKFAYALTLMALLGHFPSRLAKFLGWAGFLLAAELIFTIPDTSYLFFLAALAVLLVRSGIDFRQPATMAALALIALVALTKFTCFLYALAALSALTWLGLATRQGWKAFWPFLSFLGLLIPLWAALGQRVANLPGFVYGSFQISIGYIEGMALMGDDAEIRWALGVLLTLAGALCTFRPVRPVNPRQIACATLIGLGLFLQWKHGFVRHDANHACTFFSFAVLVPFLFPAAFPTYHWWRGLRSVLLPLAVLLAVLGMTADLRALAIPYPANPLDVIGQACARVLVNAGKVCSPYERQRLLDDDRTRVAARYDLPRIRAEVGRATVDMISYEQSLLLWNRLNWHPRPVLQSYSAYNSFLLRANASYFQGAKAPEYVLFKFEPIDRRLPTLEDGPALLAVLHRYQPILMEKTYVLLKRRADSSPVSESPRFVQEKVVGVNEEVSLKDAGPGPHRVTINLPPTFEGRLRSFLYKPRPLFIRLKMADGRPLVYRFIPAMTKAGFLIDPLATTNAELIQLYGASPGRRVVSFSIVADRKARHDYRPEFRVTLESLPGLCQPLPADEANRLRFPSFRTFPAEVDTAAPVWIGESEGQDVVLVHPDGALKFPVPTGARQITGRFGIVRYAYETGKTDGVLFVVEYVPEVGPAQVLFQRHLDPVACAEDRGMQTLDVRLPEGVRGTVVLKTTNLPGKNTDWDWAYWSGIEIKTSVALDPTR